MTTHRIQLPYAADPPLHANARRSRLAEAATVARVRRDVGWLVKHHKVGHHDHVTIGLEWRPATRRRRDGAENLAPLLKACVDGAVQDGHVCVDDTPDHVTRTMPALLPVGDGPTGLWLIVQTEETTR